MGLNSYRVNIDFEYELFDPNWSFMAPTYRKICQELEWLYLFMGDEGTTLSTDVNYEKDYLDYVASLSGKRFARIPLSQAAKPWWGDSTNTQEKKWNSKLTSFEISSNLGLLPAGSRILNSTEEVDKNFEEGMVLKSPFEFSGRGFKKKNDGKTDFPVILEPWEERVLDFGIRYDYQTKKINIIENFNDRKGQFRGGRLRLDLIETLDHDVLTEIFNSYEQLGVKDFLQVDCYQTQKGMRYLVEANHRKTMGDFIKYINSMEQFSNSSILFLNQKIGKQFEKMNDQFTRLSPKNNFFHCYAVEDLEQGHLEFLLS
jgi:hypothetical protein